MMSRLLFILVIPLYLFSSLKMTFNLHFCGDEVKYVSFSGINEKMCCGEEEEMEGGCCHNQKLSFKVNDHASSDLASVVIDYHPEFIELKPALFLFSERYFCYCQKEVIIEDPPPKVKTPLFIRNRVLRI